MRMHQVMIADTLFSVHCRSYSGMYRVMIADTLFSVHCRSYRGLDHVMIADTLFSVHCRSYRGLDHVMIADTLFSVHFRSYRGLDHVMIADTLFSVYCRSYRGLDHVLQDRGCELAQLLQWRRSLLYCLSGAYCRSPLRDQGTTMPFEFFRIGFRITRELKKIQQQNVIPTGK